MLECTLFLVSVEEFCFQEHSQNERSGCYECFLAMVVFALILEVWVEFGLALEQDGVVEVAG